MSVVSPNDAAGGAGSITGSLLNIALNGISRTVDGALAKRYPLSYFNENQTVNAAQQTKPYAAPQTDTSATDKAKSFLQQPIVIGVGLAVAATWLLRAHWH